MSWKKRCFCYPRLATAFENSMCFQSCLGPLAKKWFSCMSSFAIVEDQVKDAVIRDLLAAYILCDTAPQTKRSDCYILVGILWTRNIMLFSKGWKNVLVLLILNVSRLN